MNPNRSLWSGLAAVLLTMAMLACNLGVNPATPTPVASPTSSQKPTVSIQAPQNNADAVVNQAITVQATGSHPDGVTRLELRANSQAVDSKVSQNPNGDAQFAAYLNYTPVTTGTLLLQVIAYRGNLASDAATVTVNVKSQAAQVTNTVAAPAGSTQIVNDPTCRARVEVNGLNFRQGPGVNYPPLAVLGLGTSVVITGRLSNSTWWQGRYNNTVGWFSANFITLTGSLCNTIPAVQPPPSPVPTLTPTVRQPTATTVSLPNLIVLQIEGPVSLVLEQNNMRIGTYKVTIQNVGSVAAGQFSTGLMLPDGTLRDIGAVAALQPNQIAIFQTDVTFTAPGSVRLTAYADMNQVIAESDESNNLKSYDVLLVKPTAPPATTQAVPATATSTPTATPTSTETPTPTSTP